MKASRVITNRLNKSAGGKPKTKASKHLRKSHQRDDVKLLRQDLKYNIKHAAGHKKQANLDRKLIRQKSY